jgi:hypothetical protein
MYSNEKPFRKNREFTNLEMEAMALVNEELPGPKVTDEEKFEEILAVRKNRKPVSNKFIFLIIL